MRNKIVYIGKFWAGAMNAEAQLVLGNSRILRELGYEVVLIGNDPKLGSNVDPLGTLKMLPEGFPCYNIVFRKNLKELLSGIHLKCCLEILNSIGPETIKCIICYGSPGFATVLFGLSKFARRNGIGIIYNCVDIHNMNHGSFAERCVKKTDRAFHHLAIEKKMDGVIAVTPYIRQFFANKAKCPFVVIPPLKDTSAFSLSYHPDGSGVRHIVYAGVPFPIDGRKVSECAYKDRIDLFIDALIQTENVKYRFDIYGMKKEQYVNVVKRHKEVLEQYGDRIVFHGRIDHDAMTRVVSEAEFTVVYRVKCQMTMAGFSTKFVESICCGTPVIATDTSEYIHYRSKGAKLFILDPDDPARQKKTLETILSMSDQEFLELKRACFESRIFDYRNYISALRDFLAEVDDYARKANR